jgi:hypothetical protein
MVYCSIKIAGACANGECFLRAFDWDHFGESVWIILYREGGPLSRDIGSFLHSLPSLLRRLRMHSTSSKAALAIGFSDPA